MLRRDLLGLVLLLAGMGGRIHVNDMLLLFHAPVSPATGRLSIRFTSAVPAKNMCALQKVSMEPLVLVFETIVCLV